jgi:SRSO17 transposase
VIDQILAALDAGVPSGVVLMDAGYGADTGLRSALTALGLAYVAGIQPQTSVWTRRNPPPAVRPWSGRGRPTSRMVRDADHQPRSAEEVARSLPVDSWETIAWREGSADVLSSRFARVRVRAAHRDYNRSAPRDEEWLVLEWPPGEQKPSKSWLATVPEDIAFDRLVALAKLRWRIERDYQELKQELGLGHFEGRGWRGFHHHATLCIAAYAFLTAERARIPPSEPTRLGTPPPVPAGSPGRSSSRPTGAAHREFDRHHASPPDRRLGSKTRTMSLLQRSDAPSAPFVTQ